MGDRRHFSLEYWLDDGWYVGRLKEVPGVFSQGATLEELEENIKDAYALMLQDGAASCGWRIHKITRQLGSRTIRDSASATDTRQA